MNKNFVLFILPFILLGCNRDHFFINDFTFDIDGVHYDLSRIHGKEGNYNGSEFGVTGVKYKEDLPVRFLFYYFLGYDPTECKNCGYGGEFIDTTVQKERIFYIPAKMYPYSTPYPYYDYFESYFWIEIDGVVYDAISGYIEMINDTKDFGKAHGPNLNGNKAHGTFDFVMVNRDDKTDTIHVTNGKFKYKCYVYSETWEVWD